MTRAGKQRALTTAISLVLCWTWSGCSLLLVKGPPADHRERAYFACTSSRVGPVTDVIISVSNAISATAVMSDAADVDRDEILPFTAALAGVAVLFGVSAVGGFRDTSDCDNAMEDAAQRRDNADVQRHRYAQASAAISCVSHDQCRQGRYCVYGTCSDSPMPQPSTEQAPMLLFDGKPPEATPADVAPSQTAPQDTAPSPATPSQAAPQDTAP